MRVFDKRGEDMKQYIVDAFTDKPFSGNPAAVCVMESWPSEESMMKLAMENNLSETAFIVKEEAGYHLRWFTPGTEVELCGHATLASSFVILNYYQPDSDTVQFNTLSGVLTVRKKGSLYEMDFPTYELKEIPVTDKMEQAFGVRPAKAVLGLDLVCVFESEDQVRSMHPDQTLLMEIEGRIQNATAAGTETDCVSRSFCPKPQACHCGGSGMRLRPLPDCGLLVKRTREKADHCISGLKTRRLSALRDARKRQNLYQWRGSTGRNL